MHMCGNSETAGWPNNIERMRQYDVDGSYKRGVASLAGSDHHRRDCQSE